jgi:hypothetical protein
MDPSSGKVLGMLKIEKMGFLDLNLNNLETFRVISEWLATTYQNAQRYQKARSQSMISEETALYSYGFFVGHKDFFVALAQRMGFRLSMILVQLNNAGQLSQEELKEVSQALKHSVGQVLRKTDLAFDHKKTGLEFAIVLPGASVDDASLVAGKVATYLDSRLGDLAQRAKFSYTTHPLHTETSNRQLLSREQFETRLDFLLRLQSRVEMQVVIAVLELSQLDSLPEKDRMQASNLFRKTVDRFLSEGGHTCFAYQRSDSVITMVLPSETMDGVQKATDDLNERLNRESGTLELQIRHSVHLVSPPKPSEVLHAQEIWTKTEELLSAIH